MAADDVYRKTPLGLTEIKERRLKLSPRLRTMLILIDGAQTEAELMEEAAGVGAPGDFLTQLAQAGLIERVRSAAVASPPPAEARPVAANAAPKDGATRLRDAKNFMNATIVDALGAKSFMFATKLEHTNGIAELRDLVDAFRMALAGAKGDEYARAMTARLKEMIR